MAPSLVAAWGQTQRWRARLFELSSRTARPGHPARGARGVAGPGMLRVWQLAAAWAPRASDAMLAPRISRQLAGADSVLDLCLAGRPGPPRSPHQAGLHSSSRHQPPAARGLQQPTRCSAGALHYSPAARPLCSGRRLDSTAAAPAHAGPSGTKAQLAQISPLLRPHTTDDEHPLGEGRAAWPFNARAYYVGAHAGPSGRCSGPWPG